MPSFKVNLEGEDNVVLLLASLFTSFVHLVAMLIYGMETLKIKEEISALLSHVKMNKDGDDSQAYEFVVKLGLNNHNRSKPGGRKSNGRRSHSRSRIKKDVGCYFKIFRV